MRTTRSLPGSKFRLVAVASLAALAVGSTVVGSGTQDDTADPLSEVETVVESDADDIAADESITATTPSAIGDSPVGESAPPDVTPTTVTASTTSEDDVLGVTVVEAEVAVVDGESAPVSGVPVVVDGDGDGDTCPAPVATDGDAASLTSPPVPPSEPDTIVAPESPAPSAPTTTAPTTTIPTSPPDSETSASAAISFDDGAAGWVALSGSWSVVDGEFVQADDTGYDFITQYPGDVGSEFAATVRLRALGDSLGGGLMIGQPVSGSRRGATLVDFTDGGRFLRWGRYDADTGQYQYVGGVATGDAFDVSAEHLLTVEVRSTRTLVIVDGAAVGEFGPVGSGRLGLATSLSAVAFDDLEIVNL